MSKAKFLPVVLISLGLLACGPNNSKHGYFVDQMRVIFPITTDTQAVPLASEAIKVNLDAFQQDFSTTLPAQTIAVSDTYVSCGNDPRLINAGCQTPFQVWAGEYWTCPAIYHEFGHFILGPGHLHPLWYFIDIRGQEITNQLLNKRKP